MRQSRGMKRLRSLKKDVSNKLEPVRKVRKLNNSSDSDTNVDDLLDNNINLDEPISIDSNVNNNNLDTNTVGGVEMVDEDEIDRVIGFKRKYRRAKPKIRKVLNDTIDKYVKKKKRRRTIKKAVNSGRFFDILDKHTNDLCKERSKDLYVPKISEAGSNPKYWHKKTSGDEIVKNIRRTLDEFGYTRTDQQKIFHEQMINACIPKIYGDELDFHADRILRENEWSAIMQELLCVTPRRFGKTWAVAMFVAAILINVPYVEVVIFSMALRASRKMLALVDKFISRHAQGNKMLCRPHNQERLTLRGESGPDDERFCLSFPGRSDVLYFVTFIIIIDDLDCKGCL